MTEAAPLAHVELVVNGEGTVEPAGGIYEVGTRLTFRAYPGDGFVFGDWTDAAGALLSPESNGPELEYTVVGDEQIVAHFALTPFGQLSRQWSVSLRTYDFDASGQPRATAHGCAALTLSRTGAFTGKLRFDAETFVLAGSFDAAGRAAISFPRTGRRPLRVVLRVPIEQPQDRLNLAVYDGDVCAMSSVSTREAPGMGASYTVSLRLGGSEAMKGYAILKRTINGAYRGVGSLDDGTAFCFATQPGVDHSVGGMALPVNAPLGNGGFLSGLIILPDAVLPVAEFSAKLQWIVPAPPVFAGAAAIGTKSRKTKVAIGGPEDRWKLGAAAQWNHRISDTHGQPPRSNGGMATRPPPLPGRTFVGNAIRWWHPFLTPSPANFRLSLRDKRTRLWNSNAVSGRKLALMGAATGNSVFVGPLGDDANAGAADSPLATLDAALTRIGGAGEIVMLPGNYEHASLNLATAGKVTLRSAPGHTAKVFFGEKIMGSDFTNHQGNVWKVDIQSSVPVQGTENRYWIFEMETPEGLIANGSGLPQQRLRTTRLDHFRLAQASSIETVDAANGRYFISGNTLYLRTSDGGPPRPDQEFRIPSQAANDSLVFGAGPQCEITLRGIEIYFACNGADVSYAARYLASGCKFFGSGNSGILAVNNTVGIEEGCEYAANANDGCSPGNYVSPPSLITVIDPWSHDNGDEGHSLHGQCRGFYFASLYEHNANGGLTPAIGANAVIQGALTRGNVAGINPAVIPPVNLLVSDWTSSGDMDGLANWTSGLVTVVSSRVLNPLHYSFNAIVGDARIAVFATVLQGGLGWAAGAGGPNTTFSDAPLEIRRRDTPQATPVNAEGWRFDVPGTGQRVVPFVNRSPNGHIVVRSVDAQSGSVVELAESFTLDPSNHVTVNGSNLHQLTIEIDAQTGWFTGEFSDLAQPPVTRNFSGVIFQSHHFGTGFFQGAGAGAAVTLSIPYDAGSEPPTAPSLTLTEPNPAASARFANAVAMSGSRLVVGATQQDTGATGAGSFFLYDIKSATPAVPAATLNNPNPAVGGKFGISVAISGTRMVVGAPVYGTGAMTEAKAYVYDLSGQIPTLVATLENPGPVANGSFGSAVAIAGNWILVGAPGDDAGATGGGRAYLFALLGTSPTLIATLNNPSPAANDRFGAAVAMSGTRAVVGAIQDDTNATDAGSAYVYNVISATPSQPFATLNNPSPAEFDRFGFSVAISGNRVVIGAIGDDTGAPNAGCAYVYDLNWSTPTVPRFTLNKPDPAAGDQFGQSAAVSGTRVVVGACLDDTGAPDAGSAYIFELGNGTPTLPSKTLNNPTPAFFDQFGRSVAVDGPTVAVGLPFDETVASEKSVVYTFTVRKTIVVRAGTSAVTEGGIFDSVVIEDGGTLTLEAPPPTVTGPPGVPSIHLAGIGNARHLIVEFIRSKKAGLTYTVEFADSPDRASFQPSATAPIVTPINADLEHIVVEDIVTIADQPLRLGRVRVTYP